jgi:hypothetical protein
MYDLNKFHPMKMDNLIRLGRDWDGGYVISKDQMQKTEILLSFGINDDWSFEIDFEKEKDIKTIAFDYSVSWKGEIGKIRDSIGHALGGLLILRRSWIIDSWKQIKSVIKNRRNIQAYFIQKYGRYFIPKYLNDYNNIKNITFDNIFKNIHDIKDLSIFIKMDIEGMEYKTLSHLLPYFDKINGMAIEFHNLDKIDDLHKFEETTQLLLKYFEVIHIHANTLGGTIINTLLPKTLEITFIHKGIVSKNVVKSTVKYPINGLDFPNAKDTDDFILPYNYTDDINKIVLPYKL